MIGIKVSKTITISTVKDGENGKDGRDAADVVVSPQTIAYPAIEGWSLWEVNKYYVSVQYTDKDGVVYGKVTNIVSYTAPEGITLELNIYAVPWKIQVSIPSHTAEVGAVSAVVDLENSDGSKTVQNIPCSFNIIQKNPDYTDLGNVYYAANSQGKALGTTTYIVTAHGGGFVPTSVSKLYGPSNARMIADSTAFLVEVTQGEDVRGLILFRGTLRNGDTYIRIERQFTLVPEVIPTTYNPNFEDGDQTLADDCSDTVCIHNAKDLDFGQERTLYLPDVEIWMYRRLTIYRIEDDLQPGMMPTYPYIIYIKSQSGEDIWDYRVPESVYCPQDVRQYELKTSNKVVLWSNGSHWNLFEDDSLRASNS